MAKLSQRIIALENRDTIFDFVATYSRAQLDVIVDIANGIRRLEIKNRPQP